MLKYETKQVRHLQLLTPQRNIHEIFFPGEQPVIITSCGVATLCAGDRQAAARRALP